MAIYIDENNMFFYEAECLKNVYSPYKLGPLCCGKSCIVLSSMITYS